MEIHAGNLIAALQLAIAEREVQEKDMNYYSDSAMLAGWKSCLEALRNGDQIKVK